MPLISLDLVETPPVVWITVVHFPHQLEGDVVSHSPLEEAVDKQMSMAEHSARTITSEGDVLFSSELIPLRTMLGKRATHLIKITPSVFSFIEDPGFVSSYIFKEGSKDPVTRHGCGITQFYIGCLG
jgi:hypothetical protein